MEKLTPRGDSALKSPQQPNSLNPGLEPLKKYEEHVCCNSIFACQCFAFALYKWNGILEQNRASFLIHANRPMHSFDPRKVAFTGPACRTESCRPCGYDNTEAWGKVLLNIVGRSRHWGEPPLTGHPLTSSLSEVLPIFRSQTKVLSVSPQSTSSMQEDDFSAIGNVQKFSMLENGSVDNSEGFGAFTDLGLEMMPARTRNIDIGGGKYDDNIDFLRKSYQINSAVYDPFARNSIHNQHVLSSCPFDMATSISVLNVIKESADRYAHIKLMRDSIRIGGIAFFKIYIGDKSNIPKMAGYFWNNNWPVSRYLGSIEEVFGKQNVTFIPDKNLIIAKK